MGSGEFRLPGKKVLQPSDTLIEAVLVDVSERHGPGITVDDQKVLFTPFFRGRAETRFPQGMGLGLSISRDLITAHQGRLEFESHSGKGSCFTIWLPNLPEENTI